MNTLNIQNVRKAALVLVGAGFVWWAGKAHAQAIPAPAASMPYAVAQIVKLEQAKIGDATVIAYIQNSGDSYALDAGQIIYLKQQGVSDDVLTAMLTQSRANAFAQNAPAPVTPAPQQVISAPDESAPVVQPSVTYVQSAPTTYYNPYCYPYYNYSGCYGWPQPWLGFGWTWYGGGWHWGGGWHGGGVWRGGTWNTGWHGTAGWHGGWTGGWHGGVAGGWHAGGGGWHGGGGFHR